MKKDKVNKCPTKGCKNKTEYKGHCSTCRSKKSREKDPIAYHFHNMRNRAKQRPKDFSLTLEQFRKWAREEDFVPGRDSVDRRENEHGYHLWNIQKMPLIENIRKYHHHDKHKYKPVVEGEENPF